MDEEKVMAEVMNLLEAEHAPSALPAALPATNIPDLREQHAILVSTGKCKESIGVNLTHEQVRRLDEKEVMKYYKRYETYVGAKTIETLIKSFLAFSTKALGRVVPINDANALQNELKNDYIITKELSNISGNIALRCGRLLAVANAFFITANHVDLSEASHRLGVSTHPSRDGVDVEQCPVNSGVDVEQCPVNSE